MAASSRAFARHDPRQARARLTIALGVGVAVAFLVPDRFGVALRAVAGWDAAAFSMGALAWALIFRAGSDPKRTRRHAADDDPGRRVVWVIAILASGFSLFATAVVLRNARTCPTRVAPDLRPPVPGRGRDGLDADAHGVHAPLRAPLLPRRRRWRGRPHVPRRGRARLSRLRVLRVHARDLFPDVRRHDHQPADPARRAGARGPVVRLQHDDRRDRRQPRRRLHRLTARPPSPTRR